MSHNKINQGAFFIADAHESEHKRRDFGRFVDSLLNGKLSTTQLFLMGDMFDVLIGTDKFCVVLWDEYIKKIDKLAESVEVYYFEGNHDFYLKKIFKNVKVISINEQPKEFEFNGKNISLSHGDSFEGAGYKLYSSLIRNGMILNFLNIYEKITDCKITRDLSKRLEQKKICLEISDFENLVKSKIDRYSGDIVIEGHHHQNKTFTFDEKTYINLASFACEKIYYQVLQKDIFGLLPIKFNL